MRDRSRPLLFLAVILAGVASLPAPSNAATTVNVLLQDNSSTDNTTIQGMKMTAEPSTVKAGTLTFKVTNASKGLVHEMILIKPPADGKALPYDAKKDMVVEKGIVSLGEVSERNPGQSGTLTRDVKPGKYLLICNQPGHYKGGMWTALTVTP